MPHDGVTEPSADALGHGDSGDHAHDDDHERGDVGNDHPHLHRHHGHHHHPHAPHGHPARAPTRRDVLAAGAGLLAPLVALPAEAQIVERMARAALDWLASLDERRREKAVVAFGEDERENWHYVPRSRRGLALRDMSDAQRTRAMALLESGLGSGGVTRVQGVRRLEGILRQSEGNWRDPDNYALCLFGSPGTHPWGWRFEGHHLSLNFTVLAPDKIAVTPAFWGANPARAPDGFRLIGAIEDLGRSLIRALPDTQRSAATIGNRSLGDIVAGPGRERELGAPRGVALAEMDEAARQRAFAIIDRFLEALAPELAAVQRRRVFETGATNLRFAWAGPLEDGRACYFRVHGAVTLVELDNSQNNANHVHSVWRDLAADFGHDTLADHYHRKQHR